MMEAELPDNSLEEAINGVNKVLNYLQAHLASDHGFIITLHLIQNYLQDTATNSTSDIKGILTKSEVRDDENDSNDAVIKAEFRNETDESTTTSTSTPPAAEGNLGNTLVNSLLLSCRRNQDDDDMEGDMETENSSNICLAEGSLLSILNGEVENRLKIEGDDTEGPSDQFDSILENPSPVQVFSSWNETGGSKSKVKSFQCSICYRTFGQSHALEVHMHSHTAERPHKCHVCAKSFMRKGHLTEHVRTHSSEKAFSCDQCDEHFRRSGQLKTHKMQVHSVGTGMDTTSTLVERPFECKTCRKTFMRRGHLNEHMLIHEKPFSCDHCTQEFARKIQLRDHLATAHNIVMADDHSLFATPDPLRPFQCEICMRAFRRRSHLKEHMAIHADQKPFPCDKCDRQFTRRNQLRRHLIESHDGTLDSFSCFKCHKSFLTESQLKVHETKKHSGTHLKTHQTTHTGKKLFGCDKCGRKFMKMSHLKAHLRTHLGLKPYVCNLCEKCFSKNHDLRRHYERLHKEYNIDKDLMLSEDKDLSLADDERSDLTDS